MTNTIVKAPKLLLACIFCLFCTAAAAQGNGRISGKVVDRATQVPLAYISVSLQDTTKGTTTDSAGIFQLTGLDIKTYNLVFSGLG